MPDLSHLHYALQIEPHLESFTFDGRLQLTATPARPLDTLHLNAIDLDVSRCTARMGSTTLQAEITPEPADETLVVRLSAAVEEPFTLAMDFSGTINDPAATLDIMPGPSPSLSVHTALLITSVRPSKSGKGI